jgi:hypothetical protein
MRHMQSEYEGHPHVLTLGSQHARFEVCYAVAAGASGVEAIAWLRLIVHDALQCICHMTMRHGTAAICVWDPCMARCLALLLGVSVACTLLLVLSWRHTDWHLLAFSVCCHHMLVWPAACSCYGYSAACCTVLTYFDISLIFVCLAPVYDARAW